MFLDTNVLVSAFATRGLCADVVRHVLAEHDLVVAEVVIAELRRVLKTRIGLPDEVSADIEQLLRDREVVPKPARPSSVKLRDPADRWVLASALAGKADVLVTGDHDLLDVADRPPLPVVDPRAFWTLLRSTRERGDR